MAYCAPRGIPHSHFLGGPLRWTQADRDKALAWMAHEGRRCGDCGTHLDDWKPSAGGSRHAFHAEQFACPGCAEVERYKSQLKDAGPEVHVRLSPGLVRDCPRCGEGGSHGHQGTQVPRRNGHRGAAS